jgi:REP-associated tyrosine transposase
MDSYPGMGYAIHRMTLTRSEHYVYRTTYHIVWTPKYRHPVFTEPYRSVLKGILAKAAYDYDMTVYAMEIPRDHVHAAVSFSPPMSISTCVRILKSISAREFFKKYPQIKKKYFWGGKLWSPSYYVETIGVRNEEAVKTYIRNQLKEEAKHLAKLKQLKLFP